MEPSILADETSDSGNGGIFSSDLGYAAPPPVAPSAPPLRPFMRIMQARDRARTERDDMLRNYRVNYSLPDITASIARAHSDEQRAFEIIARTRQQLLAPPPDAPTHPEMNVGEGAGTLLAALLSGGRGAAQAVTTGSHVAMDRQQREFDNTNRRYLSQRENLLRDFGTAREDQVHAHGEGLDLSHELRAGKAEEGQNALHLALQGLGVDTQYDLAAENAYGDEYSANRKVSDAKDLATFNADIDRRTNEIHAQAEAAMKAGDRKAKDIADAKATQWTIARTAEDPDAVAGALDQLAQLGEATNGRQRAGLVAQGQARKDHRERETVAKENTAANGSMAKPLAPTVGDLRGIAKDEQQGYDMSGVRGAIGGLPLPSGGVGSPGAPNASQPAALHLVGAPLTAQSTLNDIRSKRRELLAQNPVRDQNGKPAMSRAEMENAMLFSSKDYGALLDLAGKDASDPAVKAAKAVQEAKVKGIVADWHRWNASYLASSAALAGARSKYWTLLPTMYKQQIRTQAKGVLSDIQAAAKAKTAGNKTPEQVAEINELQRKAREMFEDTYGVDPDFAVKGK